MLEDEFEMEKNKLIDGDIGVTIPEEDDDKNLKLIISLALKAYAGMMEDLAFMEPKNRMKGYEVAERYLNQAKDARAKLEKLEMDRDKMNKGHKKPQEPSGEGNGEEEGDSGGVSRKELAERMRLEKVK